MRREEEKKIYTRREENKKINMRGEEEKKIYMRRDEEKKIYMRREAVFYDQTPRYCLNLNRLTFVVLITIN